ncbi:MAG TPA: FAD-binding oxidoreductase, partial [Gammaproteobacteria bacterium]|nr:FAD-binding oxidoreductase [Gammaproteobacteria bacterium]
MASGLPAEFLAVLRALLGEDHVVTGAGGRWAYGYDNSRLRHAPDAVVRPDGHHQVREVVRLCHRYRVPLTARGAGTNTAGATVPEAGGLVLSTERMTRMEPLDADNRVLVVEPGVTNQQVQEAAGAAGFFWPPDPTSAA